MRPRPSGGQPRPQLVEDALSKLLGNNRFLQISRQRTLFRWKRAAAGEEPDRCSALGAALAVSERNERTTQGYRRFRCPACGKQFNERSESALNRTQFPSDVIALVALWRLRYKLSLCDLPEMFLIRGNFSGPATRQSRSQQGQDQARPDCRRRHG